MNLTVAETAPVNGSQHRRGLADAYFLGHTGVLDSNLTRVRSLESLTLKLNNMTGSLSPTLGLQLMNLTTLNLAGNHLTGTIPGGESRARAC